jgi:hypothetical protein
VTLTATACKCAKTSPRTLAAKELVGCCITTTPRLTLPFHHGTVYQKQHDCGPSPTLLLFPRLKIKLKRRICLNNWGDRGSIACGAEHQKQNTASRMHLKMAEALGTVHTRGSGLFRSVLVASIPKVSFLTRWQHQSLNLWITLRADKLKDSTMIPWTYFHFLKLR